MNSLTAFDWFSMAGVCWLIVSIVVNVKQIYRVRKREFGYGHAISDPNVVVIPDDLPLRWSGSAVAGYSSYLNTVKVQSTLLIFNNQILEAGHENSPPATVYLNQNRSFVQSA